MTRVQHAEAWCFGCGSFQVSRVRQRVVRGGRTREATCIACGSVSCEPVGLQGEAYEQALRNAARDEGSVVGA